MKKYYLHNGSEQSGPYDLSELRNKEITPKTEIWYEGLSDWKTADQIDELNILFAKVTPPPITRKTIPESDHSKRKPAKSKSGKNFLILLLIVIGVVGTFLIIDLIAQGNSDETPESYYIQKMSIEETENTYPLRFLRANGKYNESFWGTELKIRGEIINTATVADYKDVVLKVTYYSKTNSVLGAKEYTLYEVYKPNSTTPFRLDIDNHKDVERINWEIVSALPNN
ncbi:DUF4339 domain-containing protein [Flavobacteriaceae bacterium TK19130]|nr:DUF4339 domain-containing protein [Thermobacterium salinum]